MAVLKKCQFSVGQKVPAFSIESTSGQKFSLHEAKGKYLVLYFYPKDCTSGCTIEGRDFTEKHALFKKAGALVLGVSRDNLKLHQKFIEKEGFNFDLLADTEQELCDLFGVMKEKNMYGKKVIGVERSTFIIDPKGKLIHEWRGVKVPGHVDEVYETLKELKKSQA